MNVETILASSVVAALIAGIFTTIDLLLKRKWKKADDKDERGKRMESNIDAIKRELQAHIAVSEERDFRRCRARILRFNDECRAEVMHTQEHFDDVLTDIDSYEEYCSSHPDFKNNKARCAIASIKECYQNCLAKNNFL